MHILNMQYISKLWVIQICVQKVSFLMHIPIYNYKKITFNLLLIMTLILK